jgi:hypothetical protein
LTVLIRAGLRDTMERSYHPMRLRRSGDRKSQEPVSGHRNTAITRFSSLAYY